MHYTKSTSKQVNQLASLPCKLQQPLAFVAPQREMKKSVQGTLDNNKLAKFYEYTREVILNQQVLIRNIE